MPGHGRQWGGVALVSGWEADDPAVGPPSALVRRLAALRARPRPYTFQRDCRAARAQAAAVLGASLRVAGRAPEAEHIALLPNSTQALLLTLTALREQGAQRVVVAAPAYFAVPAICRQIGLACAIVPAADYLTGALDVPALARAAERGPAAVVVTNPAYSLGVEYAPDQLAALAAALPETATLVLDESRLGLHWARPAPWPALALPRRAVVIRSPSKVFFLNGLKLSLVCAPRRLIATMEDLGETLLGSLPGNLDAVARAYLDAWAHWQAEAAGEPSRALALQGPDHSDRALALQGPDHSLLAWRAGVVAAFARSLAMAQATLGGAGYQFSPVDSGPYVLAARRDPAGDLDCLRAAREQGVLVMAARYFAHAHPDWSGFRINLAASAAQLGAGLARLIGG